MIQGEPSLDELLDEPIIRLVAQSDGVSLDELKALFETVREWLTQGSATIRVSVAFAFEQAGRLGPRSCP